MIIISLLRILLFNSIRFLRVFRHFLAYLVLFPVKELHHLIYFIFDLLVLLLNRHSFVILVTLHQALWTDVGVACAAENHLLQLVFFALYNPHSLEVVAAQFFSDEIA